jgi:Lon protease-like protein
MSMDLPLFPLNSVLFPGMPLNLHIFEERYKQMINYCLETKQPFGVVLIQEGREALGPLAKPYTVGCTARITQVQPLAQGRMNLVAVGDERFRVLNLDTESETYLMGQVETAPRTYVPSARLDTLGVKLHGYVIQYLEMLSSAGDVQYDPEQIPTTPIELANFAAYLIRVEADEKQRLLELNDLTSFVAGVKSLYSRENALLQTMITQAMRDEENGNPGPFSLN